MQLTAIAQLRDWVAQATGALFWLCAVLLVVTAIATGLALLFLLQSIYPVDSAITAPEPALQAFAENVRATELAGGASPEVAAQKALFALKILMAQQYGQAAAANRALNRLRASRRTRAGLAILISVMLVLILVGIALATHISHGERTMPDKPAPSHSGLPERAEYGFFDPRRYTTVPIPPMQLVHKGWWNYTVRDVPTPLPDPAAKPGRLAPKD